MIDPITAQFVRQVLGMVIPGVVITSIGLPLAIALSKRLSGSRPELPRGALADITARLERIEGAIDTMAVEVERISEAQRFAARLRAGAQAEPGTLPPAGEQRR